MIIGKIPKKVKCVFSEMAAQFSHLVLNARAAEKLVGTQRPSFACVKIRCSRSPKPTTIRKISLAVSTNQPSSLIANRISRVAKTEAEDVLFEYLHSTRSLSFIDAEHISKHSPHFIQKLVSEIDNGHDVRRSLSKFLRYNPINEFEPFFESLGLTPNEFGALLPRNLMFLNDDDIMFENFHVLCDYGIPRSKIGKMYKEAREIFGYDYGVLSSKLQAYENMGLTRSTVIKLVSSRPSHLVGSVSTGFLKVLERLKGLGFKNEWVGGYLFSDGAYSWSRVLDALDFLGKVGMSETQIRTSIENNPALLFESSGKDIFVLIGRLLKLGLRIRELFSLFSRNPEIMSEKCIKNLWLSVSFLLQIGMKMEDIANIVSNHAQLLSACSLKGPRTVLRSFKVKKDGLCEIIKDDPVKFLALASHSKKNSVENASKQLEKTAFLLRLGYAENSDEMVKALKQFRGRGDQLRERFDCLVQAGLDCNVVSGIVKQVPGVLNQTKDVIEKKIDYLTNCLGHPLESLIDFPAYLCYDVGRIKLRFSMYAWVREKGAAKKNLSLSTILACSDARFVKYFVDVHPEGSSLWETLKKSSSSI